MLNIIFRILLVLSVVFQSVTAVSSENHQIDAKHLQTLHDHANDFDTSKQSANDDIHEVKDCHHCGHCNGGHFTWILVKDISSTVYKPYFESIPYPEGITEKYAAAIHRPPIT